MKTHASIIKEAFSDLDLLTIFIGRDHTPPQCPRINEVQNYMSTLSKRVSNYDEKMLLKCKDMLEDIRDAVSSLRNNSVSYEILFENLMDLENPKTLDFLKRRAIDISDDYHLQKRIKFMEVFQSSELYKNYIHMQHERN